MKHSDAVVASENNAASGRGQRRTLRFLHYIQYDALRLYFWKLLLVTHSEPSNSARAFSLLFVPFEKEKLAETFELSDFFKPSHNIRNNGECHSYFFILNQRFVLHIDIFQMHSVFHSKFGEMLCIY